jgi:DNA processing protein
MSLSATTRAVLSLAWLRTDEYRVLVDRFGAADAIVGQGRSRLEAAGLGADKAARIAAPDSAAVEGIAAWLEAPDQRLLFIDDADYPPLLGDIKDAPLGLYVKGSADVLSLPSLAIVGSRNPTQGGVDNARRFARHLAGSGFVITSGLAEGIDAAAHEAALAGSGGTIAVTGTGIDRVYPARHRELAHRIAAAGAIVTEYPPGTPPRRQHFPERNRIISGLSVGTLVVEAARRSGSLITARLAAEQGREVFAIPGSIHNPLARGCHRLIRDGAKLVETAEDIMAELAPIVGHLAASEAENGVPATPPEAATSEHDTLLNDIGHDPVSVDDLLERSGLTIAELSSMLLILELEGKIEKLAGGQYARLSNA